MGGIIDNPSTTHVGWAGTYQPAVQPQRCPNCGACPNCGHYVAPPPHFQPWPGYPDTYCGDFPYTGGGSMTAGTPIVPES